MSKSFELIITVSIIKTRLILCTMVISELFYNQRRIQKGLNFKTPNQMAEDFFKLAA